MYQKPIKNRGIFAMTTTLQEAFEKAAALPPDRQETLAAILLEEIADEDRWQQSFAQSQDVLAKLAAEALEEDTQGRTLDMDESL
jgi:hypothetical protein